jgi:hypothetical protein
MRSQAQLAYAGAVAFAGFAVFRVIREIPALSRITIALAVVSAVLGVWPSVHQFVRLIAASTAEVGGTMRECNANARREDG